jgi:hypothetical protein
MPLPLNIKRFYDPFIGHRRGVCAPLPSSLDLMSAAGKGWRPVPIEGQAGLADAEYQAKGTALMNVTIFVRLDVHKLDVHKASGCREC